MVVNHTCSDPCSFKNTQPFFLLWAPANFIPHREAFDQPPLQKFLRWMWLLTWFLTKLGAAEEVEAEMNAGKGAGILSIARKYSLCLGTMQVKHSCLVSFNFKHNFKSAGSATYYYTIKPYHVDPVAWIQKSKFLPQCCSGAEPDGILHFGACLSSLHFSHFLADPPWSESSAHYFSLISLGEKNSSKASLQRDLSLFKFVEVSEWVE